MPTALLKYNGGLFTLGADGEAAVNRAGLLQEGNICGGSLAILDSFRSLLEAFLVCHLDTPERIFCIATNADDHPIQ
jgi:hypothetical protein